MNGQTGRRFYVLDYDRCLGNAEQIYTLLQQSVLAVVSDFDRAAMDGERDRVEAAGGSFDELLYVRRYVTEVQYGTLLEQFIQTGRQAPDRLLEPGVRELLGYLTPRHPFGILTYGSEDWQWAKIKASLPVSVPALVIDHKYKIRHMKEWRGGPDEPFMLPEVFARASGYEYAKEVILVDDKATAFDGIDTHMRGYWIVHHELLPSQKGETGPGVTRVNSFSELIALEDARTA